MGPTTVMVFVRRSLAGSPRRSLLIVRVVALVVGVVVAQVQVSAGLRTSVRGALAAPAQRTLVVAVPTASMGRSAITLVGAATTRIGSIDGVVAVGGALRFVDTVSASGTAISGQVGWADPAYLRLVAPESSASSATVGGGGALIPKAVRSSLGAVAAQPIVVGASTLVDLGDAPSSFADPGLRDTVLLPEGLVGSGARFDSGSMFAAVLFDRIPDDELVRLVGTALFPDLSDRVAVVSRGTASVASERVEALAGSSGRTAVAILGAAGCLIAGAVQLTVAQRRRGEVAIRMALGATPGDVARANTMESAVLGAVGGAVGVSLIGGVLLMVAGAGNVGVTPIGPVGALASVAAGTVGTVIAGLVPTYAAIRRDPADVLRSLGDT